MLGRWFMSFWGNFGFFLRAFLLLSGLYMIPSWLSPASIGVCSGLLGRRHLAGRTRRWKGKLELVEHRFTWISIRWFLLLCTMVNHHEKPTIWENMLVFFRASKSRKSKFRLWKDSKKAENFGFYTLNQKSERYIPKTKRTQRGLPQTKKNKRNLAKGWCPVYVGFFTSSKQGVHSKIWDDDDEEDEDDDDDDDDDFLMIFLITWIESSSIHPPSNHLLRGPQFHGMPLDPPRMPRKSWSGHLVYGRFEKTCPQKKNRRQSQVWLGYDWDILFSWMGDDWGYGICYGFVRSMAAKRCEELPLNFKFWRCCWDKFLFQGDGRLTISKWKK